MTGGNVDVNIKMASLFTSLILLSDFRFQISDFRFQISDREVLVLVQKGMLIL